MTNEEVTRLFISKINELINIINLYVPSRSSSIATTRLEEAALWMNVMVTTGKLIQDANMETILD